MEAALKAKLERQKKIDAEIRAKRREDYLQRKQAREEAEAARRKIAEEKRLAREQTRKERAEAEAAKANEDGGENEAEGEDKNE